jgi:hypothetical protein
MLKTSIYRKITILLDTLCSLELYNSFSLSFFLKTIIIKINL